jgi:hypothetical protein
MARAVRVLLAAAIAVPLVASMPGRAVACDCAGGDAAKIVRHADAIVAGHVVSQSEIDPVDTRSDFVVDGVYRGQVAATITLSAALGPGGGSDCAVLYPVGATVDPLVLRAQPDGSYTVDTCSMVVAPEIASLVGDARPPPPGPSPTAGGPPPVAAEPAGSGGVSWPAVAGGAVLAVVLIAVALRRSARRFAEEAATEGTVVDVAEPPGPEPTAGESSD